MLMTLIRGLLISGCALSLALANGCGRTANLGRGGSAGAGGVLVTGGAGGMPASGGITTTGGQGGAATTGPCTDTLSAVAEKGFACPSDYASAQQWQAICSSGHGYLGSCNGFLALLFSTGEWGKECYYDSVSGALVGAVAQDDVSDYCNRTSYTIAGGSYPSDCPLSLLDDLGDCVRATAGTGGTGGAGGTGGMPGSGGTTATGGQTVCSSTEPCAEGLCVGASCGDTWTCIEDRRTCSTSPADYCGCDGVTFQDSVACPTRPYASRGACGQGTNCDQRDVACDLLPPTCDLEQFPRVVGSCWDGTCVPIEQCACTVSEECPEDLVCWSQLHCGPLER
jgi:hypothetical protein